MLRPRPLQPLQPLQPLKPSQPLQPLQPSQPLQPLQCSDLARQAAGAPLRFVRACHAIRLVRVLPWLRRDPIESQQRTLLEELLQTVRSSVFDLQSVQHALVPLLVSYLMMLHYVACLYWVNVLARYPAGPDGTWSAAELDAAEDGEAWSEWMPTRELLQYGDIVRWYCRARYFQCSPTATLPSTWQLLLKRILICGGGDIL